MLVPTEGPPDATIMIVGEAPGCFAEDVEVLTETGWQDIQECTTNTNVAQYNNGAIEFVKPTAVIQEEYSGKVIRLSGGINTVVTPNHRLLIFNKYHNKFLVESAEKLRIKYSGQSIVISGYKLDGTFIDENLVRFIVAVQADGSYEATGIRFEFSKERKIERLLSILNSLEVTYRIGERNNRETFRLTIPKTEPVYWFATHFLTNKNFSPLILSLNADLLRVFVEELKYWDGSVDNRSSECTYFEYSSKQQENIDIVQAAAHLCGYKGLFKEHSGVVRIIITKRNSVGIQSILKTEEQFSGTVRCLTVPSGFFVVRANGVVFITGNSEEDKIGRPFVGYAGRTLDNLLGQAGIARYQCLVTNVARLRLRRVN